MQRWLMPRGKGAEGIYADVWQHVVIDAHGGSADAQCVPCTCKMSVCSCPRRRRLESDLRTQGAEAVKRYEADLRTLRVREGRKMR